MKTTIKGILARLIFNLVASVELLLVGFVFFISLRYFENAIWTILNINVIDNPTFFKIYSAMQGVVGLAVGLLFGLRIKYTKDNSLVRNLAATFQNISFSGIALGFGFSGIHHLLLLLATDAFIKAWN